MMYTGARAWLLFCLVIVILALVYAILRLIPRRGAVLDRRRRRRLGLVYFVAGAAVVAAVASLGLGWGLAVIGVVAFGLAGYGQMKRAKVSPARSSGDPLPPDTDW